MPQIPKKVVIVGGHGKIALRLARLLAPTHIITSIIRDPDQASTISATGASPLVLSLTSASIANFAEVFNGVDVVYFSAGAGGKGGPEMTKKIDHEGAVKVFDAIEQVEGKKPRLIMVSAIDVRDAEKVPSHYTPEDIALSNRSRSHDGMRNYKECKYMADLNLVKRDAFQWTIVRPGTLTDEPGTGKADVGRTHLSKIPRDDVAAMLAMLLDREDASGLAFDLVGGEKPMEEGLDEVIKKRQTDFPL